MTISPTQHSDFSRTAKIGRGRKPRPIWLSEEFFEFIYFQIGQACNLLAYWLYNWLVNAEFLARYRQEILYTRTVCSWNKSTLQDLKKVYSYGVI